MKNIIQVNNFKEIYKLENQHLSLEEYGFIYYLSLVGKEISLEKIYTDLNIDIDKFKIITSKLVEQKILDVEIDTFEYVSVMWKISFIFSNNTEGNTPFILQNKNYEKLFILDELQKESIKNTVDKKEIFLKLYRIYEATKDKYIMQDKIIINDENEYKEYLKTLSPITVLLNNNIKPTPKDINLLFEVIYEKKIEVDLVNFLIEYVITTSIYNNFSINYFVTILDNWESNKINTLDKAMEHIKVAENKKATNKNGYIEPTWNSKETEGLEGIEEDLEEIEKLLSKTDQNRSI